MKKSELKALIREVVEQVQTENLNTQLRDMMKALQANPKAAQAAAAELKRQGAKIDPSQLTEATKGPFLKKLAMMLLAAGVTAGAFTSTAKADSVVDVIRWGDKEIERFEQIVNAERERLGIPSTDIEDGSVRDLFYKHRRSGVFAKYRENYLNAMENKDLEKMEEIMKMAVQHANNLIQMGSDYNAYNEKKFIPSVIAGILQMPIDQVIEFIKNNPDLFKSKKAPNGINSP